jgi:hypothetical protein
MQSGLAVIKMKAGFFTTLFGGASLNGFQHLWFVSTQGNDAGTIRAAAIDESGELILKVGKAGPAERCTGCGLVVLLNSDAPA